jgi:hypothetical protein
MNWIGFKKKAFVAHSRYYPGIYVDELRKTMNTLVSSQMIYSDE